MAIPSNVASRVRRALRNPIDIYTSAFKVISYGHHEIHGGSAYAVHVADSDFDKSDEINVCFKTPDTTKWIHMFIMVACSVSATFDILEDATVTNGTGSDYEPINRNRNSENASGVYSIKSTPVVNQVNITATISDDGTVVHTEALGADKKGNMGAGARDADEYILKQNSVYAFRLTGAGVTDNGVAAIELSWYEHTNATEGC